MGYCKTLFPLCHGVVSAPETTHCNSMEMQLIYRYNYGGWDNSNQNIMRLLTYRNLSAVNILNTYEISYY